MTTIYVYFESTEATLNGKKVQVLTKLQQFEEANSCFFTVDIYHATLSVDCYGDETLHLDEYSMLELQGQIVSNLTQAGIMLPSSENLQMLLRDYLRGMSYIDLHDNMHHAAPNEA